MKPSDRPAPETLVVDGGKTLAAMRLQLLRGARRRVAIYQPALPTDAYNHAAELDELRRIAAAGRGAEIRLILHDPAAALRDSHRLIALAQRLPSTVLVREPVEESDRTYGSAYLLTDAGGYLFLPEAARPRGRGAMEDRASQAPLQQHFQEAWERAARATALQPLDL